MVVSGKAGIMAKSECNRITRRCKDPASDLVVAMDVPDPQRRPINGLDGLTASGYSG
jgi:hypothetical protein